MKTCKTCSYWEGYSNRKSGECGFLDSPIDEVAGKSFHMDVVADDDSGLSAVLVTGPEFGCVHHVEKNPVFTVVHGNGGLSVYIQGPGVFAEVFYIAFPRFNGNYCSYTTLIADQKEQLDAAMATAKVLTGSLVAGVNGQEVKKMFDKAFES